MTEDRDWERLAALVRARRDAMGWTQQGVSVAAGAGLSVDRLQAIESVRARRYSARTLAALERGLRWEPGSIETILDGGDPTPEGRDVPVGTATERTGAGSISARAEVRGAGDAGLPPDMPEQEPGEADDAFLARVVVWFAETWDPSSADDQAVARTIMGLRGRPKAG